MEWKTAIALEQLKQAERETVVIDNHKILFIWHKEQVHAVQAQCPHFKLPLSKGKINDDCAIICPFHKSEFDLKTGEVKCWSPWPKAVGSLLGKVVKSKELKIYPTRITAGTIEVQLA
ncbi:Rieske (2Fe-2S) protein [Legionella cardiaca]|uniref:Rieske (2Fe-2S) protein n=1 Tax=Legionella cardiaca TaxID=1071983 RepID=A0ABY8AVH6_9GAMM|nr:Rieske (2Fe-2S) protein [Legionella cardiaca]WED44702.1 Rieske (2Fe-2S) protein [Legionella cardiaca]